MIDLHLHSTASDGTFSPAQLVDLALEKQAKAIAICDHDTAAGVQAGMCAGQEKGLMVIPGVELSCGDEVDIHLLGYFINPECPELQETLAFLAKSRDSRLYKILDKLDKAGVHITPEEVFSYMNEDGVTGRPHIAQAMVAKGYVPDVVTAFRKYIGLNAPCYAERDKLSTAQAIASIQNAGGMAVLAHGGLLRLEDKDLNRLLDQLQAEGMMGLECYHSSHTTRMEQQLRMQAKQRGLLVTGGSDFHGTTKPQVQLHSGLDNWKDEDACFARFLEAGRKLGFSC